MSYPYFALHDRSVNAFRLTLRSTFLRSPFSYELVVHKDVQYSHAVMRVVDGTLICW